MLLALALLTIADPGYKPVFFFLATVVAGAFGYEALKDKLVWFFKQANAPPPEITE